MADSAVIPVKRSFDSIAKIYHISERICFGQILQNVRIDSLQHLAKEPKRILLIGDGNGSLAIELLKRYPNAEVSSLDYSAGMHSEARQRVQSTYGELPSRYTQIHANILHYPLNQGCYDYIALNFVLDCFNDTDCAILLQKCLNALRIGGYVAYGDFSIPNKQPNRWLSRCLLRLLYFCFWLGAGLKTKKLPKIHWPETLEIIHSRRFLAGLLQSKLYRYCPKTVAAIEK